MVIRNTPTLRKALAVSILSIWTPSLVCFYLLEFRNRLLYRSMGTSLALLLVGPAYPVIAAVPLSRLVSRRPAKGFIVTFLVAFLGAIALLTIVLRAVGGLLGAYVGGFVAIWLLGSALNRYLNSDGRFIISGGLLACWTLIGDYLGYNARGLIDDSLRSAILYASIYSLFLGSGLGTLLWQAQRNGGR